MFGTHEHQNFVGEGESSGGIVISLEAPLKNTRRRGKKTTERMKETRKINK